MIVDIKHHNHTAVKSRAQDRAARLHWDQCIEIDLWVIESHDDHGAHQEVDNLRSRLCVIIIISLLFLVNCFGLPKLLFDLSIWYIYICKWTKPDWVHVHQSWIHMAGGQACNWQSEMMPYLWTVLSFRVGWAAWGRYAVWYDVPILTWYWASIETRYDMIWRYH